MKDEIQYDLSELVRIGQVEWSVDCGMLEAEWHDCFSKDHRDRAHWRFGS
jgi:hypothetical protein